MVRAMIVVLVAGVCLGGCASKQEGGRVLTDRQRDSVLGRSSLPGASVVQRASSTTDAAARRAAQMNAQVDSMPH